MSKKLIIIVTLALLGVNSTLTYSTTNIVQENKRETTSKEESINSNSFNIDIEDEDTLAIEVPNNDHATIVGKNSINLYTSKNTNSTATKKINEYETVYILEKGEELSKVFHNGEEGYIKTKYIELDNEDYTTGTIKGVTKVNIRNGAGKQFKKIDNLKKDDTIEICAFYGSYYKIKLEQGFGYVHYSYVNTTYPIKLQDVYSSFNELRDNEIRGVDYEIESRIANQGDCRVLIKAIHGGIIEKGTDQLVKEVTKNGDLYDYYTFISMKDKYEGRYLHVTSNNYDHSLAKELVGYSNITVSLHGYNDRQNKHTIICGLDDITIQTITNELKEAGYSVSDATNYPNLGGKNPKSITNQNERGKGVQIEISTKQRNAFFDKEGNYTEEFYEYASAIRQGIENAKKELME